MMDKRQTNGQTAPTNSPSSTPLPTIIPGNLDGAPTKFSLPLIVPGTVVGTDGSETMFSTDGTPTATSAIPPNLIIVVLPGQVITANGKVITGKASAATTAPSTTIVETTSSATTGGTTSGVVNTITSATTSRTATGTIGTLYPGNTFVYTSGSPPTITTSYLSNTKGMQPGASAGLAIGCLLAGAIVAAVACFLLFSRRNKRQADHDAHYEPTNYTDEHHLKHPTAIITTQVDAAGAASTVENNLPQPREDNAISGDLSKIKSRIEGHVDEYYHKAGANNQAVAQALSAALGAAFPVSTAKMQELLSNPRRRPALLRAAIAWIIVSRIDSKSGPTETFLPTFLAGASRELTASRMDETTRVAFHSKWRQITAALSGNRFLQEMPADDPRLANIGSALNLADSFLRPCAKDAGDDERLVNLAEIMKRAARFGFLLFSQPSSFDFDWTDNGGLVVFPGLLQISDDNGKPLVSPRTFSQKEVVPM